MTSADTRPLVLWVLLAAQVGVVLWIHIWLLTSVEIGAMGFLGSSFVQQSLLINTFLFVGAPIAAALRAIWLAYRKRKGPAKLVTGYRGEPVLVAATARQSNGL